VHAAASSSSSSGILRTIVALIVVIGIIYVVARILRAVKGRDAVRASGNGLEQIATLPLAPASPSRCCARKDIVLVDSASTASPPSRLHRGRGDRRRHRGPPGGPGGLRRCREAVRSRPGRSSPPDGAPVKIDSSNALQILVLVGGLSLIPAILFTVTGFTRILIVLGFIRSAIGTNTTPPNQVLVESRCS